MSKISNTFPILITERLTLRQLSTNDSEEIFQLRSNPEINKYLNRNPSKKIEDALGFIKSIIENSESQNLFYWAITKTGTDKLIGTICLFDFLNNKCEIGYELSTEYQNQGIMVEATTKVIEYANEILGMNAIDATTHPDNQNSTKLLEKLNFKQLENNDKENLNTILFRLIV